jgi:hypothetical protein
VWRQQKEKKIIRIAIGAFSSVYSAIVALDWLIRAAGRPADYIPGMRYTSFDVGTSNMAKSIRPQNGIDFVFPVKSNMFSCAIAFEVPRNTCFLFLKRYNFERVQTMENSARTLKILQVKISLCSKFDDITGFTSNQNAYSRGSGRNRG